MKSKRKNKWNFLLIVLIICNLGSAQELFVIDDAGVARRDLKILNQIQDNALLQQQTQIINSSVFIQQIGVKNNIHTQVEATYTQIEVYQEGTLNNIEIDEISKTVLKDIKQIGNENSITDFSFNPEITTQLELNQLGDNLTFERFGTNELTKSLKFTMMGNNKTIIVRSF